MSPWPPEGEPSGKGTKPVTLPRPGHADLAGALKHGLADSRDALERASARQTAVAVAAGAVAKALLAEIEIEVAGTAVDDDLERRIYEARSERDTVGGVVEVRARGVPPGLGSYASNDERLHARRGRSSAGTRWRTSSAPGAPTWSGSRGARIRSPRRARRFHGRGQDHAGRTRRGASRAAVRRPRPRAGALGGADDSGALRAARRG